MKTLKEVISERPEYKTLINAVIRRIGINSVEDVNNHGIDGGFSGFIYYTETKAFFKAYKKLIIQMATEMSEEMGEGLIKMISNFNCLSSGSYPNRKPKYTEAEIAEALYAGKGENADQIQNAMSFFAAEEICRMFEE